MGPFQTERGASRFLPLLVSMVLAILVLGTVLLSMGLLTGRGAGLNFFSDTTAHRPERGRIVDADLFALIRVGMPEEHVVGLLGIPSESRGPQLDPIYVPPVLNPENCDGQIPCECADPVRELFYYRGPVGESFYVYVDRLGEVCCYQRSHVARMSILTH